MNIEARLYSIFFSAWWFFAALIPAAAGPTPLFHRASIAIPTAAVMTRSLEQNTSAAADQPPDFPLASGAYG